MRTSQTRLNQTAGTPAIRERRGFALEAVLMLLVMFSIIILAGLSAVTTLARTSNADYRSARASYAAEGGADDMMSQLDAKMQDGVITANDIAGLLQPSLEGFAMTQSTRTTGVPDTRTIVSGPFTGLYSLNQPIDINVTARDSSGNRATAVLSVNAQTIPLFQFGVFYENDLEILPGAPMTFAGWVHTNGSLYLSSNSATFQGEITTPDSVFWNRKDANNRLSGVRINNAGGSPNQLDFDSRSLAGAAFIARSQARFSGRLKTSVHGVRPLKLPLPANTPPITLVDPRNAGDAQMVKDVKMSWKSDWYITVDASVFTLGTPAAIDAALCSSKMTQVRIGALVQPAPAVCQSMFKARPDAFFDGREDLSPDIFDVDMAVLRTWADANPTVRSPRIIYFEFTNLGTASSNDYVAVRLRNASQLPMSQIPSDTGGMTIVTDRPMYVLGDFNTNVWRPAALMADAITFLSNPQNATMTACNAGSAVIYDGWCDGVQTTSVKRRSKGSTVNAAILAGHSPTTCDYARAGCGSPVYGGGLENFPRFLESWSGRTFTYTGSLVSLFVNRYSMGAWNNAIGPAYYDAPTRAWQFDVNFRFPERLPPGTPSVGTVLQTAFRPLY